MPGCPIQVMGNRRCSSPASGRIRLRAVVTFLAAVTLLTVGSRNALACECAPPLPACAEYSGTQMIFLGTVTEALQTKNDWVTLARMRIDKAYKGISEETVILYDDGMCDGPSLHVGEQYLMYTHDNGTGYLPSRGCTRSRNVKYAGEDMAFLNSLSGAAPTGTLSGKVTMSTGNMATNRDALPSVTVEALGEGKKATTTTDNTGRYSFSGLEPGSYVVSATKAGFSSSTESEDENTAKVAARGCALLDLVLRKNWPGAIGGRIVRSDGSPVQAGLKVDLIRVEGEGRNQKSELLIGEAVETDNSGEYLFSGVAPGSYKIVLNLYRIPTEDTPYRTQYWPRATTEGNATEIEVSENANSARCDFHLPAALTSKPVRFVVLLPDSTPARGVHANIAAQLDGMSTWVEGETVTDESGRFSFNAIEGFDYTLGDIMTDDAFMASKLHFSTSDRMQPITIRLVPKER